MKSYNISREEFAVLTFLHEHAQAYDPSGSVDVTNVAKVTALALKDVVKAISFLASLGLVGLATPSRLTFATEGQCFVYLTGDGEQMMREVESRLADEIDKAAAEPGPAHKITTKIGGVVYDVGKAVIVKVLTDWMSGH